MQVRVETLADLKRIKFNPFDTVFCVETEKEYFLNLSGESLTPDDDDIVQAIHGANARYVAMVAKVIGGTPGAPAILDQNGKVPLANMPASVFTYKGGWNAATNTPELADGVGTSGDTYRVTHAGAVDFGAGAISFSVGDKAVYNGTTWEKWDVQDDAASGEILQEITATDAGGSTASTSLANLNLANVSITPKSPSSVIIVDVQFQGRSSLLSGTNTLAAYRLYEATGASDIGEENQLTASAESQGVNMQAPINVRARIANAALTERTFQLRARTNQAGAPAHATNMVWSIREIKV